MPAHPRIESGIGWNLPGDQRSDIVHRSIPFHFVREFYAGSQLRLVFGRSGGRERDRGIGDAGIQRKVRLKKTEPWGDSPPFCHVPVRGNFDSVVRAMSVI